LHPSLDHLVGAGARHSRHDDSYVLIRDIEREQGRQGDQDIFEYNVIEPVASKRRVWFPHGVLSSQFPFVQETWVLANAILRRQQSLVAA
jgi:hypothetical protein